MRLADVTEITVSKSCVDTVYSHLRRSGREGYEGLALWVGHQDGGRFQVTRAIVPEQIQRRTPDGVCVILASDALHKLNVLLYKEKLTLLAQIHSHPGRAYHSSTDDAYAVATTVGCLSIVVPNFGRQDFDPSQVATYRLSADARWVEVPGQQARQLIRVEG